MSVSEYLVTFDISQNSDRRAVHRRLERLGPRLLYSVYEVAVPTADVGPLQDGLEDCVRAGDHLLALHTCESCWRESLGGTVEPQRGNAWVVA